MLNTKEKSRHNIFWLKRRVILKVVEGGKKYKAQKQEQEEEKDRPHSHQHLQFIRSEFCLEAYPFCGIAFYSAPGVK